MKNILLIIALVTSTLVSGQNLYKGLEVGMTKKEAKSEFKKNKEQYIETIMEAGLASDSKELDERFNSMLEEHRTGQLKRSSAIKAKIKAAKEAPGSMEQKRKIVTKSMKEFIRQNPEPFGAKSDSFIKDAKKRKKSAEWKEWKTSLDNYRYEQWSKFGEK